MEQIVFYCSECKEDVQDSEVIIGNCPWCREERVIHKKCGNRIYRKI